MRIEKFEKDARVVHKFIQLYCDQKHKDTHKTKDSLYLNYKDTDIGDIDYDLCQDCENTLKYSHLRLLECPHEEKPSCRKCPSPCYEKNEWKKLAKIMKYSGMQMGLIKIRKLFTRN